MALMRAVARYSAWVERSPIVAKSVTAASLTVAGDVVAQGIEGNFAPGGAGPDLPRLARMGVWGLCIAGPLMHFWYRFLDTRIVGSGVSGVVKKLVVDQSVWAPSIVAGFFTYSALAEGLGPGGAWQRLSDVYVPAMKMNYMLWPAANVINFAFVPPMHRVLYVSSVALVWNTYVCFKNAQAAKAHTDDAAADAHAHLNTVD